MKKTNAIRLLDRNKITYELVEYTYDTEDLSVPKIAEENNLQVEQVYKTLVAKGDKTGLMVAVVRGDLSLNFKALAKVSGNKKIALIPVKDIQELTGYIRGGCSPLGMKKDYSVYIDEHAKESNLIYVNAGARGLLMGLAPEDLLRVSSGMYAVIGN